MPIKKTLAVTLTALLALSACGSDSDDQDAADGGPETADLRVWLNGTDTPQEARDWLKTTFEDQNPGSTLTIEEQQWDGLVEKLTTSLSSESETPDVVEIGNTQAPTFTAAGAFSDVTGDLADWGGDDLLPGFVDGATVDGTTYAVPYYAGSKYIFYRTDLFEEAGIEVPTTTDEFVDAAIALKKANPDPANFSGFWFPGQDWRNGARSSGTTAATWPPATATPGRAASPRPSPWRASRPCRGCSRRPPARPRTATRPTRGRPSAPGRSA